MTPKVDNVKKEYPKVQIPFVSGTFAQSIYSASDYKWPVETIGEKLSTGNVNPTGGGLNVETEDDVLKGTKQNTTNTSGLSINGYSITQIRRNIENCGWSDIENVEKLSDEELYNRINSMLANCKQKFTNNQFLKSSLNEEELSSLFETVIIPQLFENGFYYGEIQHSVETILENFGKEVLLGDPDKVNYYIFANRKICQSGSVANNTKDLITTIGSACNELVSAKKLSEKIEEHLKNVLKESEITPDSEQYDSVWLGELARLALYSQSTEEKEAIYDYIKSIEPKLKAMERESSTYADLIQVIRKSCENANTARNVDHYISADAATLPKEIVEDMIREFDEGGIFYNILSDAERTKFEEIKAQEKKNESLSPEDEAFLQECYAKLEQARETGVNLSTGVITRIEKEDGEGGDFTLDEAKGLIQTICGGIEHNDRGTYEDFLQNIHEWFTDNGATLNISEEAFTDLMFEATGGLYPELIQPRGDSVAYEPSSYNNDEFGFNQTVPPNLPLGCNDPLVYYAQLKPAYQNNGAWEYQIPQYLGKNDAGQSSSSTITTVYTSEGDEVRIFDILTGKVDADPNTVIAEYKTLDIKQKGACLAYACTKFFDKLISATENVANVIIAYFATGNKGCDVARTDAMQGYVDEAEEHHT